jgi:hypothetical protein
LRLLAVVVFLSFPHSGGDGEEVFGGHGRLFL